MFGVNQRELNFMIVGGISTSEAKSLADLGLTVAKPAAGSRDYTSNESLISSLRILHEDRYDHRERATIKPDVHRVRVKGWYYFTPQVDQLKDQAEELRRDLEALWPHHRYLVTTEFKNKTIKAGGRFSRAQIYLGDIIVRRRPDKRETVVTHLEVDDQDIHSPVYVAGRENIRQLMGSLSVMSRLRILDRVLGFGNEATPTPAQSYMAYALVDSLSEDFLIELEDSLLGGMWRGSLSPKVVTLLRNHRFSNLPKSGSFSDKVIQDLYARTYIATYYGCSDFSVFGTASSAIASIEEDLEYSWNAFYPNKRERKAAQKSMEKNWDALAKEANVSWWSFNSTNHAKVQNKVFEKSGSPFFSARKLWENEETVRSEYEIEDYSTSEENWNAAWLDLFNQDQQARKRLKMPAKKTAP
jgi:hypothetical protein